MIYKDLDGAIKDSVQEIEDAAEETLKDAGKFAREEALSTTKFQVSTTFRQATQFHTLDRFHGFVLADKPYAEYLEFGNNQKGSYIYPVQAKALHFQVGGQDVFVKKVKTHEAYNFMSDAGQKLEQEIDNIFLNNLNKTIKE